MITIVTGECTLVYKNNTVLRFVWFSLIFIQLIIKFISIYPESSNSNKQQHHSTSLTCYHIATSEHQYCIMGSDNRCEGDRNLDLICLFQSYLTIHYCNQSVLVIVPDLNIFVWSITVLISFIEAPWCSTFLLRAIYFYNSAGTKVLQFWFVTRLASPWLPLS